MESVLNNNKFLILNPTRDLLEKRDVLHFLRQGGDLLSDGCVAGRGVLQILKGFHQFLCLWRDSSNNLH